MKMAVTWFSSGRVNSGRQASSTLELTFTMRPRGVRFNAAMTKDLQSRGVKRVMIGHEDMKLIIKPIDNEDAFRVVFNSKSASSQVSASMVGAFAERNLKHFNFKGIYDEKEGYYVFDLKDGIKDEIAATGEVLTGE